MRVEHGRIRRIIFVALAGAWLAVMAGACSAYAQPELTLTVHIDGLAGADTRGNWTVVNYAWGNPTSPSTGGSSTLTFTHDLSDGTSVALMKAVSTHQTAATAELQVQCTGSSTVTTLDYSMVNARLEGIAESGVNNTSFNFTPPPFIVPLETVTLAFKELDYTYQPILPNCQKNGPPTSFEWKF